MELFTAVFRTQEKVRTMDSAAFRWGGVQQAEAGCHLFQPVRVWHHFFSLRYLHLFFFSFLLLLCVWNIINSCWFLHRLIRTFSGVFAFSHTAPPQNVWRLPGVQCMSESSSCPCYGTGGKSSSSHEETQILTWEHSWHWRCSEVGTSGCCARWLHNSEPRPSHLAWPRSGNT